MQVGVVPESGQLPVGHRLERVWASANEKDNCACDQTVTGSNLVAGRVIYLLGP